MGDFKDGKNLIKAGSTVDEAAFAEKQTHGLSYWNKNEGQTPAWAAKKTLIPAEQIIKVARTWARRIKLCRLDGARCGHDPRGTYAAMAVYALNGILGSIETEGGVYQSSSSPTTNSRRLTSLLMNWPNIRHGKSLDGRGAKDMLPSWVALIPRKTRTAR